MIAMHRTACRFRLGILTLVWSTSLLAADCQFVSSRCLDTSPVKSLSGVEVPVSAADGCWEYEDTYECLSRDNTVGPECEALRARGCSQTGSRCVGESDRACAVYEQTYECPSEEAAAEQTVLECGGQLICLEGDCFDTSYEANGNLARVGALLSVMDALSQELEADHTEVFRGEDRRCGLSAFGARNCCKLSGWAEGVLDCSFEEELLADLRQAGRCHYVGRYCSKKTLLGVCRKRKQTYCCFGSKLSRILAEQGHLQLARGWGHPKRPDCSGFTLEEVSRLDFEAMDLSEFYEDVIASMPTVSPDDVQQRIRDQLDRLHP